MKVFNKVFNIESSKFKRSWKYCVLEEVSAVFLLKFKNLLK